MSDAPPAARPRILVVDDNAPFLDMVDMVFGAEFEVLRAADGLEGLELARKERPAVILLDVMMPKVSGTEVLKSLQAEPETRRIPVIILTASAINASTQELLEREVNCAAFLRKPCGTESLRRRIREVLEKPHRA